MMYQDVQFLVAWAFVTGVAVIALLGAVLAMLFYWAAPNAPEGGQEPAH